MEFSTPIYGIFAIIAGLLWVFHSKNILFTRSLPISSWAMTTKRDQSYLNNMMTLVGIIAWALISFSMMGPREIKEVLPGKIKVNDIMFIVDISKSMTIQDMPPNRLEVAKEKIYEFVSLRPKDRIGVIVFSEKVLTLLPLTTDNELIKEIIKEIRIITPLGSGTNIGDSLALGVGRLAPTETLNKVIILLTDGVSNVDTIPPIEVAKIAAENKIKVYTIGIGLDKNALLPGIGRSARRATPGGAIDFSLLEEISKITGAKSYKATSAESLGNVFSDIQKLEKTEVESRNTVIYKELYYQYLLIGVLLLLLIEVLKGFYLKEVV